MVSDSQPRTVGRVALDDAGALPLLLLCPFQSLLHLHQRNCSVTNCLETEKALQQAPPPTPTATYLLLSRPLHLHVHAQGPLVPLAVHMIEHGQAVLEDAVAHWAVVSGLLRERHSYRLQLRLVQIGGQVQLVVTGLQVGSLYDQALVQRVALCNGKCRLRCSVRPAHASLTSQPCSRPHLVACACERQAPFRHPVRPVRDEGDNST